MKWIHWSWKKKDINDREHESPPTTRGQSVQAHTLIGEWRGPWFKSNELNVTDSHPVSLKIARFHWDKCAFLRMTHDSAGLWSELGISTFTFSPVFWVQLPSWTLRPADSRRIAAAISLSRIKRQQVTLLLNDLPPCCWCAGGEDTARLTCIASQPSVFSGDTFF